VVKIEIPPLRKRPEDIPVLLEHFMERVCRKNNLKPRRFSREALDCLMTQRWEGNVRELSNLVERLMVSPGRGPVILEELPEEYRVDFSHGVMRADELAYGRARESFERTYMARLLEASGGDLRKASMLSGLDLSTLYRRRKRASF